MLEGKYGPKQDQNLGLRKDTFSISLWTEVIRGTLESQAVETLSSMGYSSTEYDPDVWINRAITETGTAYYKHISVYVDDVLHLSKDAQNDMLKLNQVY